MVDYFSRFVEIQKLTSTTSVSTITVLKSIFALHGIPITLVTDNGPQFISNEMTQFSSTHGFQHVTSSSHYHQYNGQAERAVRTVKALLSKCADSYLALLSYRATPLPWCGLSPAQLLMGCTIRTDVLQHPGVFQPEWSYLQDFREGEEKYRNKQTKNYDEYHRSRPLPDLPDNYPIWVDMPPNGQVPGCIVSAAPQPTSYFVDVPSGQVRRNRFQLRQRDCLLPKTTHTESSTMYYSNPC